MRLVWDVRVSLGARVSWTVRLSVSVFARARVSMYSPIFKLF